MDEQVFNAIVTVVVAIIMWVGGYVLARYRDPLRRIKELSKHPVVAILATAVVAIVEAYWTELDGQKQFEAACDLLARMLKVEPEQVEGLIQAAYEALKALLGEEWDSLKLNLSQLV